MNERNLFPQRLADARKAAGLSQEALAERLDVSRQAVSKWESGQAAPAAEKLPELARTLGTTVDALFGGQAPEPDPREPLPAPPRRSRWAPVLACAAAGAFLALLALVFWTVAQMSTLESELAVLRQEVSALEVQTVTQIVEQPAESTLAHDFGYRILNYDQSGDTVTVALDLSLRSWQGGEAAVFRLLPEEGEITELSGGAGNWGRFTAVTDLHISVGRVRVDALVTNADGVTVTETVGTLENPASLFPLEWWIEFQGSASKLGDQVTVSGPVSVPFRPVYVGHALVCRPAEGTVTLSCGDTVLAEEPLDFDRAFLPNPEGADPIGDGYADVNANVVEISLATAEASLGDHQFPYQGPVTLTVSVKDNFGNVSTQSHTYFE